MEIIRNRQLADFTTWRIGGPASHLVLPQSEEELVEAIRYGEEHSLKVYLIGRGSNLLVSDSGLQGLVVVMRKFRESAEVFTDCSGQTLLSAGSGLSLPRLSRIVADLGYSGFEFYVGIPGTVGGAIYMNAGYGPSSELQTANLCRFVRYLDPFEGILEKAYSTFNPRYRWSDFQNSNSTTLPQIILGGVFELSQKGDRQSIRNETAKHLALRKERQPLSRPTAGSVFRATEDGTPAAVWIDKAGLKGRTIGGAQVSTKHANWIENTGEAKATDVLDLIEAIKSEVYKQYKIELHAEVEFLED